MPKKAAPPTPDQMRRDKRVIAVLDKWEAKHGNAAGKAPELYGLTCKEIAAKLELAPSDVSESLKRLLKTREVTNAGVKQGTRWFR